MATYRFVENSPGIELRRIAIVGGGFGGVYTARRLDQILGHRDDVTITLLSHENFLLFTPMLPEVASSSIEAGWIQPGEPLGQVGATPILRVTRFWEKPSEVQAKA
jgi:hypothetical protein